MGTHRSAGPRARVRALCPTGPFGYANRQLSPPLGGDQTKRGVSLNFPDQVTSERRFGATPQSNCPYAWCSTSELMTWQKKSRGLQSTLRKTENIAPVRANRERLLCSLIAHSSTLGEVSFFLEESRRHSSTSPMTCSSAVARPHVGRLASRASVADRRVASRAAPRRSAACSPCVASAVPKVIYACPLVHLHSNSPLLLSARSTVFVCTPAPDVSYVSNASPSHQGSKVLVVGSTGGVGQLVVAKLLEAGYVVRATSRNPESARQLFGANDDLELCTADLRDAAALTASGICDGIDAVVSCTGTTAFPSARWKDGNGPENTDFVGTSNLVSAVKAQSPSCKVS